MSALTLAAVLIIVIILVWFVWTGKERMSNFYLDQMAMANSNPTNFIYTGNERDQLGMSQRDYYLNNQTNYANGVAPGYFEGDKAFKNQTQYLDMPSEYRPRSRTGSYIEPVAGVSVAPFMPEDLVKSDGPEEVDV